MLRKGLALQATGETQAAWPVLEDARHQAIDQGSKRSLLPILATMYPIAVERGDDEAAASIREQGVELIDFMKGKIEDTDSLEKFLQTPNVKVFLD